MLGALLARATGRTGSHSRSASLYAISDEAHQTFVPGRHGVAARRRDRRDRRRRRHRALADRAGTAPRMTASRAARDRARRDRRHASALVGWLESRGGVLGVDPASLPVGPRRGGRRARRGRRGELARAARALRRGARARLSAPRRVDERGAAVARVGAASRIGVFTDAPEPLARVALAQLGASRRVSASRPAPARSTASSRRSGPDAVVVARRNDLLRPPVKSDAWSSTTSEIASSTRCSSASTGSPTSSSASIARPSARKGFTLVARELHELQESLNALAYAALGQAPPRVRRRAS